MKAIILIVAVIFSSQCLSATLLQIENYLHQVDKTIEYMLIDIEQIMVNSMYSDFIDLVDMVLESASSAAGIPITTLGKINTKLLTLHAGEVAAYYAQKEVALAYNRSLEQTPALALIQLYAYALIHYDDRVKRLNFYTIMTKNHFIAPAIIAHENTFIGLMSKLLGDFVYGADEEYLARIAHLERELARADQQAQITIAEPVPAQPADKKSKTKKK